MIIYIDQGNSYTKWRVCDHAEVLSFGAGAGVDVSQLAEVLGELGLHQISALWLANVAGGSAADQLLIELNKHVSIDVVHVVKVQKTLAGLSVAYDDVSALGVDRWLAMLASHCDYSGEKLIISAGTAITIDKVDSNGQHLGGLIAPGWRTLCSAVQGSTANISSVLSHTHGPSALGRSTKECLQQGVTQMLKSYIECADRHYGLKSCTKIVCGGDAELIYPYFSGDVVLRKALVMDGLRVHQLALNTC